MTHTYMTDSLFFFRDITAAPVTPEYMEYQKVIGLRKVEGKKYAFMPYLCKNLETIELVMKEFPGEWTIIDNTKPRPELKKIIETHDFQVDIGRQMSEYYELDFERI